MSFWTRAETELQISIQAGDPHTASVMTNWPYYLTRVQRCEGFSALSDYAPKEGGRELVGEINIGAYNYLWLRRQLTDEAAAEFTIRYQALGPPERTITAYRADAGERETVFLANAAEPYWLSVETDAATWLRRLDAHPYAVLVCEQLPDDPAHIEQWTQRRYLIPRRLLTIRRNRVTHEITDEQRQVLRDRLARARG